MTREVSDSSLDALDDDVLVVGAGFAGLTAVHKFRERGYSVRAVDTAGGVGGTWYWNRYPGARVDVESMEYCCAFDEGLQQEWHWTEKYSAHGEVRRYLQWVAERLDLLRDISFHTRVDAAAFDEAAGTWMVTMANTETGRLEQVRVRYLVMATGFLSAPVRPDIEGLTDFDGRLLHTGAWPDDEDVDLSGRVGVIGAAASGVQVVQTLAGNCEHLLVFQRNASWALPLRNGPITPEYEAYVKANYAEIRRLEIDYRGPGMVLLAEQIQAPETRSALEVSPDERREDWEYRWANGALHMGRSFVDLVRSQEANDDLRAFLAEKIRGRVKKPDVAEKLIPDYPPLTRRPPGESGYYEAFNRDDVTLVDVKSDPIVRVTAHAVILESGARYEVDALICATGYDAGSGAMLRVDITGRGGLSLTDHWAARIRTQLGLMTSSFPNMFMLNAAQTPSAHFSPPLLADFQTNYILRVLEELEDREAATVEPAPGIDIAWADYVNEAVTSTLIGNVDSWWTGANVRGKVRQAVSFVGGFQEYRRRAEQAAEDGFHEFVFQPAREKPEQG